MNDNPIHILKICKQILSPFLAQLFYRCVKSGIYPECLKCAQVIPSRLSLNLCCLFQALSIEMCCTAEYLQRKHDLTCSKYKPRSASRFNTWTSIISLIY